MKNYKKLIAGISALTMLVTSTSLVSAENSEPTGTPVITRNFEDGVMDFSGRDGYGTLSIVSGGANGSDNALCCSDRTKSWQGPQFNVGEVLEVGVEYTASAWVKTEWYNDVKLSMEYTDANGERHYSNLSSATSQGDWVEIPTVKFTIPKDVTNVYLYFECNDIASIYVDDFVISTAPVYEIQKDIPSLKDVYSPYFKFGGALMDSELASPSTKDLVLKHYNSITFGNELKPENVLDQKACQEMAQKGDETNPQVTIASARNLLDFCQENNIPVRGHVLVWHSQTPDWFFKEGYSDDGDWVSQEVMLQRMENYIKNVMETLATEYPDVEFYAWDVVNEIWLDDGKPRQAGEQGSTGSNNSAWVKIFGDNSFVDYAFEYARKYAPEGCKLYYNDFNEYMPQKTQAIVEMVTRIKEAGNIDGIGMQSHLDVSFPSISVYEKALKAFCDTGLDVQITELDVTTSDTSETGLETQAQYYSDIMDLAVKYSDNISAVVIWGTTDDKSWRSAKLPVLFNEDYTAKPCYYSIVDGLDVPVEPPVTEETTTDETTTDETTITEETTTDETTITEETTTDENTITEETTTDENTITEETTTDENTITEETTTDETTITEETTTDENTITEETTTTDEMSNVDNTETTTDETIITDETTTNDTQEESVWGDISLDGKVMANDLVFLKKHVLKISTLEGQALANADITHDGQVMANDLLKLKKFILKIITQDRLAENGID